MPPPFSAKKVGGVPAYKLARRNEPVDARSRSTVTVHALDAARASTDGPRRARGSSRPPASTSARWRTTRAAARLRRAPRGAAADAGRRVQRSTRRCRSTTCERGSESGGGRLIPLERLLPDLPAVSADRAGRRRAASRQLASARTTSADGAWPRSGGRTGGAGVRLLDGAGALLGDRRIARRTGFCIPSSSWCKILSRLEL